MLRKILAAFGFGWRRLGDASTFSWALPTTWGTAVSVAGSIATAFVSAAYSVPSYLLIPLAAVVALLILAAVNLSYVIRERRYRLAGASATSLEIHFDPANPARRFWSFESPHGPDGAALPGIIHEYRVAIFNPTARTIRNVGVTVESLGLAGFRPQDTTFDKGQAARLDIHPGCFELVPVLRWPHPKAQPGMLAGPSALVGYGPLLITASADDAAPATRTFWFDWGREPMLFDSLEPGEEEHARASLTLA